MSRTLTATIVAAEFVSSGDPYRDDKDDPPRDAGTYITLHLDDADATIVGGKVLLTYLQPVNRDNDRFRKLTNHDN